MRARSSRLKKMDRLRIVEMILFAAPHFMRADAVERRIRIQIQRIERLGVAQFDVALDVLDPDSADPAHCALEIAVDHAFADSDRLKDLRALIGLHGGNAHL